MNPAAKSWEGECGEFGGAGTVTGDEIGVADGGRSLDGRGGAETAWIVELVLGTCRGRRRGSDTGAANAGAISTTSSGIADDRQMVVL